MLATSITLTQQKWVGGMSIYSSDHDAIRDVMHQSILTNELPDTVSTWTAMGANGLNIRLVTVFTAEAIHRATNASLRTSYFLVETTALFACCLLLYAFLRDYAGAAFAMAGLLYFGTVLPLTYLNHYFHPWDKPSIASWLLALICTRKRSWLALAAVLVIGVAIKFDIVVFPILVYLAYRHSESQKVTLSRSAILMAVAGLTYVALRWLAPNGFEPRPLEFQLKWNFDGIADTLFVYPPLLALGVPGFLAIAGYSRADQFARACFLLAIIVTGILFLQTNFIEFRAEVPILLLLLPSAYHGIRRLAPTLTGSGVETVAHVEGGR